MEGMLPLPRKRPRFGDDEEELPSRPHDPLVAAVMEEEQAKKAAKKSTGPAEGQRGKQKKKKGLTLEEVERLEGDTVKESQVGMAASRRADKRKSTKAREGTDMLAVDDLVDVEEALLAAPDDGDVALEPFNLAREREEGRFDDGGNYVENRQEDDPAARDAWLASDDAAVVSDETRQRIEAQQARMARAEDAPEITPRQAADLMRRMTAVLQPRETAMAALRRLRPKKPTKTAKSSEPKAPELLSAEDAKRLAETFEDLTEAASTLMDAGELDIYSIPKEELQLRADRFPAESDDFDMFGEPSGPGVNGSSDSRPQLTAGPAEGIGTHAALAVPVAAQQTGASEAEVDYSGWPIKELTRFLKERGQDPSGITEKADLVARVREVAARGPEGEQPEAPQGYVWDPSSSLFYGSETGMYYDAASSSFYTPADGKWWNYDAVTGQYAELPPAS